MLTKLRDGALTLAIIMLVYISSTVAEIKTSIAVNDIRLTHLEKSHQPERTNHIVDLR